MLFLLYYAYLGGRSSKKRNIKENKRRTHTRPIRGTNGVGDGKTRGLLWGCMMSVAVRKGRLTNYASHEEEHAARSAEMK